MGNSVPAGTGIVSVGENMTRWAGLCAGKITLVGSRMQGGGEEQVEDPASGQCALLTFGIEDILSRPAKERGDKEALPKKKSVTKKTLQP